MKIPSVSQGALFGEVPSNWSAILTVLILISFSFGLFLGQPAGHLELPQVWFVPRTRTGLLMTRLEKVAAHPYPARARL